METVKLSEQTTEVVKRITLIPVKTTMPQNTTQTGLNNDKGISSS